jgi:hypothetical protein
VLHRPYVFGDLSLLKERLRRPLRERGCCQPGKASQRKQQRSHESLPEDFLIRSRIPVASSIRQQHDLKNKRVRLAAAMSSRPGNVTDHIMQPNPQSGCQGKADLSHYPTFPISLNFILSRS